MKKFITIIILFALFQGCKETAPATAPIYEQIQIGIADLMPVSDGEIIKHTYYSLSYNEEHEQANWVFYMLYPELINGSTSRTDDFREDPSVSTGSATLEDYKGSGYDRGHMCPAGSMTLNKTAMSESFYLSNMSPQHPSCNRGKWKSLENRVREWTLKEDTLYVATGAIFDDIIERIGSNEVTVPGWYYKVIYDPTGDEKMIAFIMPNAKMDYDISHYATTVREVEERTGINFFPGIEDSLQKLLESKFNFNDW